MFVSQNVGEIEISEKGSRKIRTNKKNNTLWEFLSPWEFLCERIYMAGHAFQNSRILKVSCGKVRKSSQLTCDMFVTWRLPKKTSFLAAKIVAREGNEIMIWGYS